MEFPDLSAPQRCAFLQGFAQGRMVSERHFPNITLYVEYKSLRRGVRGTRDLGLFAMDMMQDWGRGADGCLTLVPLLPDRGEEGFDPNMHIVRTMAFWSGRAFRQSYPVDIYPESSTGRVDGFYCFGIQVGFYYTTPQYVATCPNGKVFDMHMKVVLACGLRPRINHIVGRVAQDLLEGDELDDGV